MWTAKPILARTGFGMGMQYGVGFFKGLPSLRIGIIGHRPPTDWARMRRWPFGALTPTAFPHQPNG